MPTSKAPSRCGGARYVVQFTSEIELPPEAMSAEIQQALFWDGAATAGYFDPPTFVEGVYTFWLYRPDCESDYHECYADDSGHDGSDKAAIAQLQGEINEALESAPLPPLGRDYKVTRRERLTSEQDAAHYEGLPDGFHYGGEGETRCDTCGNWAPEMDECPHDQWDEEGAGPSRCRRCGGDISEYRPGATLCVWCERGSRT